MRETVKQILEAEGINLFGILPADSLTVINPKLMPPWVRSAIILAVPYDDGSVYTDGVSAYAHITDYHLYFKGLFDRIIPKLEEAFPVKQFFGSADHSPIHEKEAAAKAGLGVIGMHSMLINERYGSYLFLGSVLTDMETQETAGEVLSCTQCGACLAACPGTALSVEGMSPEKCLSALSQKKRLTKEEAALIGAQGIAWGCDRCQEICPLNADREFTCVPFFKEHRHGDFSAEEVAKMSDEEFRRFAFSWRGRARILENLSNLENLVEQRKNP